MHVWPHTYMYVYLKTYIILVYVDFFQISIFLFFCIFGFPYFQISISLVFPEYGDSRDIRNMKISEIYKSLNFRDPEIHKY